jgi:hypothetical protein
MTGAHASVISATVNGIGDSFSVDFDGSVDGNPQAGLTSTAAFTVDAITYDNVANTTTWDFTIALTNTSSDPITDSRVSGLAFDTDPIALIPQSSVTGGGFTDVVGDGSLPTLTGSFDICLTSGPSCQGGGGIGPSIGDTASLMLTLAFSGDVTSLFMDNFAVRYQSIVGSSYGTSGVGTAVPLPPAIWLFLSALMGLFAARRLRTPRNDNATSATPSLQTA